MDKLAILGGDKLVDIPFPHFEWPPVLKNEIDAVVKYMENPKIGKLGIPEIVEYFEDEFKRYHNTEYALALNSGTSALHAAYYALGIGSDDEVIVPNFTFPATALPLFPLGAIPVLCDCLKENANIDPLEIEKKISLKTKAIAVTHLWGHPCDMEEIMNISKKYNIPVIEDCAHSHGAKYNGKLVGTFGSIGCFSLDNQKLMASGEAGIMITNSRYLFEKAIIFSDFGGRVKNQLTIDEFKLFDETGLGLKYRIHPLAAVIANEKLKNLDKMNEERVSTLDYFSKRLNETESINPPVTKENSSRGGYYGYKAIYKSDKLRAMGIEKFIRILQAEGVDVRKTVTPPLHRTKLFSNSRNYKISVNGQYSGKSFTLKPEDFPVSEWFQENHLSFPTFSYRENKKIIDLYISAIKKVEDYIIENTQIIEKI